MQYVQYEGITVHRSSLAVYGTRLSFDAIELDFHIKCRMVCNALDTDHCIEEYKSDATTVRCCSRN